MSGFLLWLLTASLQACIILPWTRFLAAVSQRAPAAWMSLLLAIGILLPVAGPWINRLIPGITVVVPWVEKTGLYDDRQDIHPLEQANEPMPPPPGEIGRTMAIQQWWTRIFTLWAAGAVVFTLGRFWFALRARLAIGRGVPLAGDDPIRAEWDREATSAGLRRTPWVVTCDALDSPQIVGVIQPSLALPPGFGSRDLADRAMIFRHEAEHLARHDPLRRLILEAARTLFWFHPLFPWLIRQYDLQVERACDDAVLKEGHTARDYAELLLAEARARKRGGKSTRTRLLALLGGERVRNSKISPILASGYLLLITTLLLPALAVKISPWKDATGFHPLVAMPRSVAGWWRARIGHGNAIEDWSGHGRHGRILGANWVKDPERGTCLEFNGNGDVLALPASASNWTTGPLTLAMWLKPRKHSDGGGLLLRGEPNRAWSGATEHRFGRGNIYVSYGERELLLAGDIKPMHEGKLSRDLRPGLNLFGIVAISAPESLPDDRWTHLAATLTPTLTGTRFRCFFDGVKVSEDLIPYSKMGNSDWPTAWWWFGRGESPPVQGNDFEGRLSDLAVLTRSLDEIELRELMKGRIPE